MKRFAEEMVPDGLTTAWRFAICPTSTSPRSSQATTDGVRRDPSWLGMTFGSPPSITATTLLVVPRSIPIVLAMVTYATFFCFSCSSRPSGSARACWHRNAIRRPTPERAHPAHYRLTSRGGCSSRDHHEAYRRHVEPADGDIPDAEPRARLVR